MYTKVYPNFTLVVLRVGYIVPPNFVQQTRCPI